MADAQSDIFIRDGKAYVAIDHLNTVLASAPDRPLEATIASTLGPDGGLRCSLQLRPIGGARVGKGPRKTSSDNLERDGGDTDQRGSKKRNSVQRSSARQNVQHGGDAHIGVAHDGAYRDAQALVEQLRNLQAHDETTLDQLLTRTRPPVLSELSRAEGSLVPLATANDGRVFSVLVGSTMKSDWERGYPSKSFQPPTQRHALIDSMALNDPITPRKAIRMGRVLDLAEFSQPGHYFRESVETLFPQHWEQYRQLIERPMDIGLIRKNLKDMKYQTMAQFLKDVDLLRRNTAIFFGPGHRITSAARNTLDVISSYLGDYAAMTPRQPDRFSAAVTAKRSRLHYGPIREVVYKDDMNVPGEEYGYNDAHYPRYVVPLGRVCVAQSANDEIYATRRVVVMDITSPRKALWVFWDCLSDSPAVGQYSWLPKQHLRLLNTSVRDDEALFKLADDISFWDIVANDGGDGNLVGRLPNKRLLKWDEVIIPDDVEKRKVFASDALLDRTWRKRIVETIKQGWGDGV